MAIAAGRGRSPLANISPEAKWLAAISVVDLVSTVVLIAAGMAEEANPLMAYFLQFGLGAFCAAKLLFVIPPILLAEWYRQYNDRLMRSTLRFVTIAYVVIYVMGVAHYNS